MRTRRRKRGGSGLRGQSTGLSSRWRADPGGARRRHPVGDGKDALTEPKVPQVVISDRGTGLPYSKGLMASQVMVTGLSPTRAYEVAGSIEDRLRDRGST